MQFQTAKPRLAAVLLAISFFLGGMAAMAQITVSGTVSSGGPAVANARLAMWLNDQQLWSPPDATGVWDVVHDASDGSGLYSEVLSPTPSVVEVSALAIGYERGLVRLDPAATATVDFDLTPGTLRVELETDTTVSCQLHSEGWRPSIITDGGASAGRHLRAAHNWTNARIVLYFPAAGDYQAVLRYKSENNSAIQLRLDNVPTLGFAGSGGAWTTPSPKLFTVASAGWHTVDVYITGTPKGGTDGLDYLELSPVPAVTISGNVSSGGSPVQARVEIQRDGGLDWPGSSTGDDADVLGDYSATTAAYLDLEVAALAIGYQRQSTIIDPVVTTTGVDFDLVPGILRMEAESDFDITNQLHEGAYTPTVVYDIDSSQDEHVNVVHYWTQGRSRLYFPGAGDYLAVLRYRAGTAIFQVKIDNAVVATYPSSSDAWVVSNPVPFSVGSAGWKWVDIYVNSATKGSPEGVDYLEIYEAVTYQIDGTVTAGGSPFPNARVAMQIDDGVNQAGASTSVNTDGAGEYAEEVAGNSSVEVTALAVNYLRPTSQRVEPIADATVDFELNCGLLRIEAETDMDVTYQGHPEGWRPLVTADGGSSAGAYLQYAHHWTQGRSYLYLPEAGAYTVNVRYKTRAAALQFRVDGGLVTSFPGTGNAWSVVTSAPFAIGAPGWHNLDLYAIGIDKGGDEGVDYLEVVAPNAAPTAACKNIDAQLDSNGQVTVTAAQIDDGSSDADGDDIALQINGAASVTFTCADEGPQVVTLTVSDCWSESTCPATVTVKSAGTCEELQAAVLDAVCGQASGQHFTNIDDVLAAVDGAIATFLGGSTICDESVSDCRDLLLDSLP